MGKKRKKGANSSLVKGNSGDKGATPQELDELEALRLQNAAYEAENEEIQRILGDEYVGIESVDKIGELNASEPPELSIPSWSKTARVKRALELNRRLKKRVGLLLTTIDQARVSHDAIEHLIDLAALEKKKRKEAAPHSTLSTRKLEYNGKSWFWGSINHVNKALDYPQVNDVLFISRHLPLVNKSGTWSREECDSLRRGVEEIAKERMTNDLIASVETIEDFDILQKPLRLLSLESPEILSTAETFTDKEWETLASRHLPSRTSIECLLQWKNKVNPLINTKEFNPSEVHLLISRVDQYGENAWEQVAEKIQGRTPLDCLRKYQQIKHASGKKCKTNQVWTSEDMRKLQILVQKHGQAWKKIDSEFGGVWGGDKLMHIWRKHLQATGAGQVAHKKGPWSKMEDELLLKAVAIRGKEWSKVSLLIPGRTEMQCRERYVNHLDPGIKSSIPFTDEENAIIAREVPKYSNKIPWSKIAQLLSGRTDRQCRKAWQKITRRENKERRKSGRA